MERATPQTDQAMLECRNLSIQYAGKPALRDVTLRIPRGEITAIVGPSGCGKTSFLQSLNRITDLISGCRVTGQVLLDGHDIYERQTDLIALRRRVGMIFQKPNPFPLSIRANLDLPLKESGIRSRSQRAETMQRALQDVGLWDEVGDRLDAAALTLSGGQQQRLCIARALTLAPDVLLFDEPCSALDPISSRTVEEFIVSLRQRTTIIIVTHNLAQARRMADYGAMFWYQEDAGRLIESAAASILFQRPQHPITAAYMQGRQG